MPFLFQWKNMTLLQLLYHLGFYFICFELLIVSCLSQPLCTIVTLMVHLWLWLVIVFPGTMRCHSSSSSYHFYYYASLITNLISFCTFCFNLFNISWKEKVLLWDVWWTFYALQSSRSMHYSKKLATPPPPPPPTPHPLRLGHVLGHSVQFFLKCFPPCHMHAQPILHKLWFLDILRLPCASLRACGGDDLSIESGLR